VENVRQDLVFVHWELIEWLKTACML